MPDAYEVLQELNEKYKIIIASIGTYSNIFRKSLFIKEKLPFIKNSVLLVNDGVQMTKEIVKMGKGAIFIDDVKSNLDSSDATLKMCFGGVKAWNEQWEGLRISNWQSVRNYLI